MEHLFFFYPAFSKSFLLQVLPPRNLCKPIQYSAKLRKPFLIIPLQFSAAKIYQIVFEFEFFVSAKNPS